MLIKETIPALVHLRTKDKKDLSYGTIKQNNNYSYFRIRSKIKSLYTSYAEFVSVLKHVKESHELIIANTSRKMDVVSEMNRLRIFKMQRRAKANVLEHNIKTLFSDEIKNLNGVSWQTEVLKERAGKLYDLVEYLDNEMFKYAEDVKQTKTW